MKTSSPQKTPFAAAFLSRAPNVLQRRLQGIVPAVVAVVALTGSSAQAIPTVYTVGDSTVQTWASGYYPKAGWGQVLPKFFDLSKVNVVNKAVGGTSSKSFYNYYWTGVKNSLVAGDYVFVQFGINDRATDEERHTDAATTFKDYLRRYVNETKARGANPVIVATLRRNAWNSDGVTVYDAYHGYPIAAREVAAELNVPCVDLDGKCRTLMQSLGQNYTTYYWYMNMASGEWSNYPSGQADNVHFQEAGAIEMAKLVTDAIRESTFTSMRNLVPALRPTYTITFERSNPSAGMITRTQVLPQGLTITALARPNSGYSFLNWSGSFSSTRRIAQFTSGTSNMTVAANFSGGTSLGTWQAESGALSGNALSESTNGGFNGAGYVNFPANGGVCRISSVNGGSGGAKTLVIRYANGSGNSRTGQLLVNGAAQNITFPATGAWTTWNTLSLSVSLNGSTNNTIEFRSTGSDLANVDEIRTQ